MILRLFLLCFFVSLAMATTKYEDAYAAYDRGEFKESLEMFKELVKEDKDYDAAYMLGYMYENAEGCSADIKKSQEYYKISAEGYYWQRKADPSRDSKKEHRKVYTTIDKTGDKETQGTIKQYVESLYNVKAYKANYFLPLSTRIDNGKYANTGTGESAHQALKSETEFQVSLKYDMFSNLLGLHEIYTVAYTQLSFWQLYTDSAYFRETNYNPEMFVTIPLKDTFVPNDFVKALRVGFAHQSNGRGGDEERSWNYFYGIFYFQYKYLFTELKLWSSWDGALEYNPELLHYLGYGHIKFSLPYKKHLLQLTLRSAFNGHNAAELNYTYPLFGRDDLFLYVKGFSGYGESLIDYDNRVEKIGFGFSISR